MRSKQQALFDWVDWIAGISSFLGVDELCADQNAAQDRLSSHKDFQLASLE